MIVICGFPSSSATSHAASRDARGPGHGPKYYLSVSHYGRQPQMDYIPQDYQSQASECLANYHRLREILDEVCAINQELLCRREVL
ncbi:MAG: DUF6788 family protein [Candidatus Sulfotelmatobacter sp.]